MEIFLNNFIRFHNEMLRRVTIVLDDDLLKKLRIKQAKLLKTSNGAVSLSRVINDYLRDAIKK